MSHIELETLSKTAPRHRLSDNTCHDVLDVLFQTRNKLRFRADEIAAGIFSTDNRNLGEIVHDQLIPDDLVIQAFGPGLRILEESTFPRVEAQTLVGLANVWLVLRADDLFTCLLPPSTGREMTQSTALPTQAAEEQLRLDTAFTALMTYVSEPEDVDDAEDRPKLKYRVPR